MKPAITLYHMKKKKTLESVAYYMITIMLKVVNIYEHRYFEFMSNEIQQNIISTIISKLQSNGLITSYINELKIWLYYSILQIER